MWLIIFIFILDIVFGYEEENPLFDGLEESINRRSRVAILGFSRAGKSTLLRLASKEQSPDKGEVHYDDGIVSKKKILKIVLL